MGWENGLQSKCQALPALWKQQRCLETLFHEGHEGSTSVGTLLTHHSLVPASLLSKHVSVALRKHLNV